MLPAPTPRVGEPGDTADIARFLVGDAGAQATGQNFTIEGGEINATDQL
jgi:NAD(P)-dependent dehydrogenase (short-subunit alcohol dehydrogenase family)